MNLATLPPEYHRMAVGARVLAMLILGIPTVVYGDSTTLLLLVVLGALWLVVTLLERLRWTPWVGVLVESAAVGVLTAYSLGGGLTLLAALAGVEHGRDQPAGGADHDASRLDGDRGRERQPGAAEAVGERRGEVGGRRVGAVRREPATEVDDLGRARTGVHLADAVEERDGAAARDRPGRDVAQQRAHVDVDAEQTEPAGPHR